MSLAALIVLLASGGYWWQSRREEGEVTRSECVGNVVLRVELRAPLLNDSSRSVGKSISDMQAIHNARCPMIYYNIIKSIHYTLHSYSLLYTCRSRITCLSASVRRTPTLSVYMYVWYLWKFSYKVCSTALMIIWLHVCIIHVHAHVNYTSSEATFGLICWSWKWGQQYSLTCNIIEHIITWSSIMRWGSLLRSPWTGWNHCSIPTQLGHSMRNIFKHLYEYISRKTYCAHVIYIAV